MTYAQTHLARVCRLIRRRVWAERFTGGTSGPKSKTTTLESTSLDAATGEWEIAETEWDAVDSLRERCPDAVDVVTERVGYRAATSFGGAVLEEYE